MLGPTVIALSGRRPDVAAVSSMLRTVLESGEPYTSVGVVGEYELFDGSEWLRGCNADEELARATEHLAHARQNGLSYLILELDDAPDEASVQKIAALDGVIRVRVLV